MKQYIDKATVVAQANIEITNLHIAENEGFLTEYGRGMLEGLEGIVDFINNIEAKEIKEVDIENAVITEWDDYIKKIDGEANYAYMLIKRQDYISLAKHFYELGLTQKRE